MVVNIAHMGLGQLISKFLNSFGIVAEYYDICNPLL
jgi:hypothetical protein